MTRLQNGGAGILLAAATFLVPQLAHATRMPGVGEVLLLLAVVGGLVGIPVAGITVLVVGLVSRSRGRPKSAGYLVKLGLIVFAACPVTALVVAFGALVLFG